jgi:hypothetical protein
MRPLNSAIYKERHNKVKWIRCTLVRPTRRHRFIIPAHVWRFAARQLGASRQIERASSSGHDRRRVRSLVRAFEAIVQMQTAQQAVRLCCNLQGRTAQMWGSGGGSLQPSSLQLLPGAQYCSIPSFRRCPLRRSSHRSHCNALFKPPNSATDTLEAKSQCGAPPGQTAEAASKSTPCTSGVVFVSVDSLGILSSSTAKNGKRQQAS